MSPSPDRWAKVERLYHAAVARPVAVRSTFLADACAGDEELRREVESLLAQPSSAADVLARGAVVAAAGLVSDVNTSTWIGRRIAVYQILAPIGAGGMGEVYRARDTRLGRDVAIKILPRAFTSDPDRLARFEREARVLAALNHPHIGAIYGIEDSDGVQALVLEYVDGETLAERIAHASAGQVPRSGPAGLPIKETLDVARQIADALDAAHEKGIVHRDLKPANIKITSQGVAKVLDFGLAKLEAGGAVKAGGDFTDAPTITLDDTREGLIVGTAAYMSPEQARGLAVDKRTDVWAFGGVLYEMLTGRTAFAADTVSDTIARILERDPDWQRLPPTTPARIRNLLRQCLQKDPAKRLADLGEARHDIEACLASPLEVPLAALASIRWRLSRPSARWTLVAAAAVVAAVGAYRLRDREAPLPQLVNATQVTSAMGVEDHPTWSPDNRTVAYESGESGNWDIWLTQVGGGPAVNRTADHSGVDRYPSWSPDGRQIAFWSDRDGGGYFVVPALGGTPTKIIATPGTGQFFHSAPEWSADGAQLAAANYAISGSRFERFVDIVSVVSRDAKRIPLPGTEEARLDLSWSPDGRYLAYVENGQQQSEVSHLRVLRLSDRSSFIIIRSGANVRRPRWSRDGRYLYFVCNCVGPPDLWRQRIAEGTTAGEPERVTSGLEMRDFQFSVDGTRLVYAKGRWISNFWRVPLLKDRPATWADAEQVTFDEANVEFLDVSPDGSRVAYSSDRSGNQDIWVKPIGGEPLQLTREPAPEWGPGWSPDGEQLAFYSYRSGDREIWVMPASGGAARQLTHSPGLDAGSMWSPDGREIAFRSERTGNSDIWVISADGARSRQITNHPASDVLGTWSPDGKWLAFLSNRSGRGQLWRTSAQGGEAELLTRGNARGAVWSRDGASIYFIGDDDRVGNVWQLSLRNHTERPVTNLVGRRGTLGVMPPSSDGKNLYFPWRDDRGDIWVMDVAP